MSKHAAITPEAIKKIGKLARIRLNDDNVSYYQQQLNGIFNWIDALQNVDVSGIDLNVDQNKQYMHERQDNVTAPNRVADVLSNAPASMHDMFSVPKVVE